jgi:hypothetical protein
VSVPLEQLPEVAMHAWTRLRKELLAILGEDLIAIWAYGGATAVDRPPRSADLDTHVIEEEARRPEAPRHAYLADRRDTSWAINRAYWLAGRYARVYGREPAELVPPPTWSEVEVDLHRELEHLERHVAEGDTDPDEATYAFLNGSRILHAVETGDVAISKRSAGKWALEHLPVRWHAVLGAAGRAYDGQASSDDADLLASEMAPFVAMVKERLPIAMPQDEAGQPRWSGY